MCGDCSSSAAAAAEAAIQPVEVERIDLERKIDSIPKHQEDFSGQEFKEYCQRRLEYFLKYKERQEGKVGLCARARQTDQIASFRYFLHGLKYIFNNAIHHWQVQQAKQEAAIIKVSVVNDGSVREGIKGVTTSMDIAKQLDKKVVKAALSSSVDGQIWDLTRPLEADCTIQILSWEDARGKDVRTFSNPHQLISKMVLSMADSIALLATRLA